MTLTSGLQLRAFLSSIVVERVGDLRISTDRNAAARQSASIILSVLTNRNAAARQSASIILFVFTLQLK